MSVVAFVLVLAPFAAVTWDVDAAAWKYIVPSALLELAYIALLAAAYRRYELSLVYPIARGLAPVATLILAVAIVDSSPSAAEIAGIVVVASGVLLVAGRARGTRRAARCRHRVRDRRLHPHRPLRDPPRGRASRTRC